jgi:uncharacterized membrane-anchored protein
MWAWQVIVSVGCEALALVLLGFVVGVIYTATDSKARRRRARRRSRGWS